MGDQVTTEQSVSKKRLYIVEWREAHPFRGREFTAHTSRRAANQDMLNLEIKGERTLLYEIDLAEPVMEKVA